MKAAFSPTLGTIPFGLLTAAMAEPIEATRERRTFYGLHAWKFQNGNVFPTLAPVG